MDQRIINKYKDVYLKKSKTNEYHWSQTSKWPFHSLDKFPNCKEGWFTYMIDENEKVFYVGSLFYNGNNKDSTDNALKHLKKFAKDKNCNKMIFYTARDGRVWEKRFKDVKIKSWTMEVSL